MLPAGYLLPLCNRYLLAAGYLMPTSAVENLVLPTSGYLTGRAAGYLLLMLAGNMSVLQRPAFPWGMHLLLERDFPSIIRIREPLRLRFVGC